MRSSHGSRVVTTLVIASREHLEVPGWPAARRWTRWRRGPPPQWSEQRCQLGRVRLRVTHGAKAGDIEVAIEGAGPQRTAVGGASGGRRLESRSDASSRLLAGAVAVALEHMCRRPSRGIDACAATPAVCSAKRKIPFSAQPRQ